MMYRITRFKCALILVFVLVNFSSCDDKISTPCHHCKVFIDSFKYWLDKTSRGKFEGGDANWEETKLKAYAKSEVRLVEIQENLCSELKKQKDACYSIAEDVEHLIEQWWSKQNSHLIDLYTWLCIENHRSCCPKYHFGEECTPCPMYRDKVCNGHGSCSGDGTRKGDGTCICDKGYSGDHCGECDKNYYKNEHNECRPCHKACEECVSYGSDKCKLCRAGWELKGGDCVDVDECSVDMVCKSNQYCLNSEGSYMCKYCDKSCLTCIGNEQNKCTSCQANHVLWHGKCLPLNEFNSLLLYADKRLMLYISLYILIYILHNKIKSQAIGLGFIALTLFVVCYELRSDTTIKDSLQNHLINAISTDQ